MLSLSPADASPYGGSLICMSIFAVIAVIIAFTDSMFL
jgi:hypothetical protein